MIYDLDQIKNALIGGGIIGMSVSIMLLFKGRVTGISGLLAGSFSLEKENIWKIFFILGLLFGGAVLFSLSPNKFESTLNHSSLRVIAAGLLVGFGTRYGNGCTSGHGVCGISRFSKRSIVATLSFMAAGILTVYVFGVM